ncbi:MAG: sugar transferase [Cyclobacteriaceae bacterium]|nr:sugar transferase [Cyclobacteriaceae bacterium HetDA_MAG_MS6]
MSGNTYHIWIKPVMDIVLAFLILVLLSPLLVIVVLLVAIDQKGRVFFKQLRPGEDGILFEMYKFQTMLDISDQARNSLTDQKRITTLGRWLRRLSLDELPQLFNVIRGEMSLIGPRPLLVSYLPLYNEYHQRRHKVKPGITGLAQVSGRNNLAWKNRLDLDVAYVENISWHADWSILKLTLIHLLTRRGADFYESTHHPFDGKV